MNNKIFVCILIILFFFIDPIRLSAKNTIVDKSELSSKIDSLFKELSMTGLSVVIVHNESIFYEKTSGYRVIPTDSTDGQPLKDKDLFRIASISKTFIATVIMKLIEIGKLNLNDDAQKYLSFRLRNPNYPNIPITIEMLLTHTSSINDSRQYWSIDLINPKVDNKYKGCYSPVLPGSQYQYCNLNYNLLGAIIENITNERFYNVVDSYIMKPLKISGGFDCNKLDSSRFVKLYKFIDNKFVESKEAYKSYKYQLDNHYILGKYTGFASPCGGMKITAKDLAIYMMMHMYDGSYSGVKIIDKSSELKMRNNYVGKYNYGYSFRQYRDLNNKITLYGQTGGAYGMKSAMIFDPENKLGFIILSSGSTSSFIDGYGDIHKPIIKLFYSLFYK